jgi:hypothetical protein
MTINTQKQTSMTCDLCKGEFPPNKMLKHGGIVSWQVCHDCYREVYATKPLYGSRARVPAGKRL